VEEGKIKDETKRGARSFSRKNCCTQKPRKKEEGKKTKGKATENSNHQKPTGKGERRSEYITHSGMPS